MTSGDTLLLFRPQDNESPASAYAQLDLRNGHPVLAFDDTTAEFAVFSAGMPRNYAGGGITVYVHWAASTAITGTAGWTVEFETVGTAQDTDSDGFATAQTITATTVSGTAGVIIVTNVAITAGATGTDSVAAGNHFRVRLKRDVASDNAVGDVHVFLVELKET